MSDNDYLKANEAIIEQVRQIPALKAFEEKEFNELMGFSKILEFKPGELIIAEGCYEGWIYYLISGKCRIIKNGKELVVLQRTGDIFGEMGVIDGSARSASVYAIDDTMCLAIDVTGTDKLSLDSKLAFRYIIYRDFAEVLANRLRLTTEELIHARKELEKLDMVKRLNTALEELASAKVELSKLKSD